MHTLNAFNIIAHNAADSETAARNWLNSETSHLEIDVQQTRKGFVAQHSRIKGMLASWWLWPYPTSLEVMLKVVTTVGKRVYIDYKSGNVADLVAFLQKEKALSHCTFVIYGRHRAEQLKILAPQADVFLHVGRRNINTVFAKGPNTRKIGVCLSSRLLHAESVAYFRQHDAEILATFANSVQDVIKAFSLQVWGITTDLPSIAQVAAQLRIQGLSVVEQYA